MILLDTHIWIWWVQGDEHLTPQHKRLIQTNQSNGLGISTYSCWEVAKLVEYNRLDLPSPLEKWFAAALAYPGIQRVALTIPIIVESTRLENFHKDPADQLIVATARVLDISLLTADRKILNYSGVKTLQ